MPRYPRASGLSYALGPGPMTQAIKVIIIVNIVCYVLAMIVPEIIVRLGLVPSDVFGRLAVWQPVTYLFLHEPPPSVGHILFNMLMLWMFGTELERMWGTRFFTKYYFVCGVGAAVTTLLWSISPLPGGAELYDTVTIGASGAIYGVLLAYAMYFPNRLIYIYMIVPIPVKYFVMIMGAIAFLSSLGTSGSRVANVAHLGGLVAGYLYLKGLRGRPLDELKYRWLKWKMNRARSRFDVYSGGRRRDDDAWKSDWKNHIH